MEGLKICQYNSFSPVSQNINNQHIFSHFILLQVTQLMEMLLDPDALLHSNVFVNCISVSRPSHLHETEVNNNKMV
jgi:hypothetical protein